MTSIADAKEVGSKGRACYEWLRRNERLVAGCVAAALVVPCIWQPHIESVDLPSHVYNAWLASLIAHGQIAGLRLVHPLTNVLADWILSGGLALFGPAWAARILCAIAVEAFFWGTFAFTSVVNEKHAWVMTPCLAMLSYGLIFYCGWMNFYLSAACAMWMVSLLWRFRPRRLLVASLLGVAGILANPLPVAWGLSVVVYVYLFRFLPVRMRAALFATAAVGVIAVGFVLARLFVCQWRLSEMGAAGVLAIIVPSQFLPFGTKYLLISAGILILWLRLLLERLDSAPFLLDPLRQLWMLNILAFFALPSDIRFSAYGVPLGFVEWRVAFFVTIIFCAWVGGASHGRGFTRFFSALAGVYFIFLYADALALNRADAEIASLVSELPPGQRVVASVTDRGALLNGLRRVSDWACIGRCFDFANYEPSSLQFRVQATGPSRAATASIYAVQDMEEFGYRVTSEEAPLYSVCPSSVPGRRFELRKLEVGEKTCVVSLAVTPPLGHLFW